jgi:hypothetical protein
MRRFAKVNKTIGFRSIILSNERVGKNPTYASVLALISTYEGKPEIEER